MPELSHLKTFVLTIELGSLVAASHKLGISAAAVSKQLTSLEKELGIQLLTRSTRSLELTDIGASYFEQCKRVLEEVQEAYNLITKVKATPSGSLKIVSSRYFATTFIVPNIKEFLKKYPKIEINLELGERMPDLNSEGVDLLIGMSISSTGDVIQKKIATTTYSLCASPKYLEEFGTPKKPEELKNHRYLTHTMRKPDTELTFRNKQTITLHPYLRTNDTEALLKLALTGAGVVKLHHYMVQDSIKKGLLQELLCEYTSMEIPIYAAFPQRRFMPSKLRCFLDFIVGKIKI